ncbi:MAG: bifunctional oligoribonuclease/PAP phosphatase NrnA [Candidatus Synoicihabitans palmerolidicus]|nr:bifunctional oligoribonuclease/PAP phosphatase NrnA [Candidatus Synoicihabitans palmerolidicus]
MSYGVVVTPELITEFGRLLHAAAGRPIAVMGHARPDGDCIGSQIALTRALREAGYEARCVNADVVPRRLDFVARDEVFLTPDSLGEQDWVAIYVDCADQERAGLRLKERFPVVLGNIDHHVSNQDYATFNCVSPRSAATCEIIAALCVMLDMPIDRQMAQALYTGILTDTGQFRFASTTHCTFELAATLVAAGADPVEAGFELYEREPAGKMLLLQRFLSSLEMHAKGKICVGTLVDGVFAETGTNHEDTEGLVDYARAIDGVEIGCLIEERQDGVKASLRAKNPAYRVDQVASLFNGGGHACAAGLNVKGIGVTEFCQTLVAALTTRLGEIPSDAGI